MALTLYDWAYGIAQFAASFLSVVAGLIALTIFYKSFKIKILRAWRYLIPALVLFAIVEVVGALKTFGVYSTPYLTHLLTGFILAFLIIAIVVQTNLKMGWVK